MFYFTADTHFGHTNIIKYCNRPFSSAKEMDDTIIDNINSLVQPNDTLYHLGDFSMGPQALYRNRIKCKNIFLIKGNHDKQIQYDLFIKVADLMKIKVNNVTIVLCHYAMRVWDHSHHGSYHLFGHSHSRLPDLNDSLSFDVGVDGHDFKPWDLDEIVAKMQTKTFQPINSRS